MTESTSTKGIIIAAPASGSGKTVLTLGLLAHFAREGIKVAPLKVGPDYIDPAFHGRAVDGEGLNIDSWAMRPETQGTVAAIAGDGADMIVCEGVMGLFDGATPSEGSTADIAALTGWPVVLVVDARRQGASAAAVVKGFQDFRKEVHLNGVIFNRVGSQRHENVLRAAMAAALPRVPVLGCVPFSEDLELPSRHLGLVQASEHASLQAFLSRAGRIVARHVDTKAILDMAQVWQSEGESWPLAPLGQKIAVARDEAFTFAYPLTLAGWRAEGAEIEFFSPLEDQSPSDDADAVFLPGGYPELHIWRLASADRFMGGLRDAAERGAVVYGECGGYMVLGRGVRDADGTAHAMAGLLPLGTSFEKRELSLGYRRLILAAETPLGAVRHRLRGHEFHYATITNEGPGDALFEAEDAEGNKLGKTGLVSGKVFGSFIHLIDRDTK